MCIVVLEANTRTKVDVLIFVEIGHKMTNKDII